MIGCGYWGPNLLRNLTAIPDVEVARVADSSPERRRFVTDRYPTVATTEHADDVLGADLDAVVIATPARTHDELVRRALDAQKDVFVEKPLALDTETGAALARRADQEGRILMVGHTFLYNEAVRNLKARIDQGEVGKVHYLYSQRLNLGIVRSDVNAAWNLAPHDISIGNYLMNAVPVQVAATSVAALQPDAHRLDDVVFMNLRYPDGTVMHTHVSWLDPRKVRTMTVVGDKKMIVYNDVATDKLYIYDRGITRGDPVPEEQTDDFGRFKMITRAGDLTVPNLRMKEPLAVEMQHFVDCVRHRSRPLTDAWSAVAVTAVLQACDRSLADGGSPVAVPAGEPRP